MGVDGGGTGEKGAGVYWLIDQEALRDGRTPWLYIGESSVDWQGRIHAHLSGHSHNGHLARAVAKRPQEFVPGGLATPANKVTEAWLIEYFGGANSPLLYNHRSGGEGGGSHSETSRRAMRRAFADPEHRKERSRARRAQWKDPVIREKMLRGMRAAQQRPEMKEKLRRYRQTPEGRQAEARRQAKMGSPKTRARLHTSQQRRWTKPFARLRHSLMCKIRNTERLVSKHMARIPYKEVKENEAI